MSTDRKKGNIIALIGLNSSDLIAKRNRFFFSITLAWSAALHVDIDVDVITAVEMLSIGLSLPNETGRGLSEHGDASRETLSESSSLNTVPAKEERKERMRIDLFSFSFNVIRKNVQHDLRLMKGAYLFQLSCQDHRLNQISLF